MRSKFQSQDSLFTPLKILSKGEQDNIKSQLKNQFGIKDMPGILLMRGKERIFLFTGDFDEKEIKKLESKIIIERTGVYFGKQFDEGIRLSIEGSNLLKDQITKNIFNLDSKQAEDWIKGQDLNISVGKRGFLIMKYENDFLGCGKASEKKIGNFIPKSRRLRERR